MVEEARLGADAPPIDPAEAEQVEHAVCRRRIEFATGRWCARRALARLQIESFVLKNGPDRAPRWPSGVVGSITHTGKSPGGFCGVAVGRSSDLLTVGLDAEREDVMAPSLRDYILTPPEQRRLDGVGSAMRAGLAKVMFSAKECFYKAQYPLSGRFLRFQDVEIDVDVAGSMFEARLTAGAPTDLPLARCVGRYLMEEEFVVTGVAIQAGAPT
jgi:4'-phosphopantetheinyl transferase EntD